MSGGVTRKDKTIGCSMWVLFTGFWSILSTHLHFHATAFHHDMGIYSGEDFQQKSKIYFIDMSWDIRDFIHTHVTCVNIKVSNDLKNAFLVINPPGW